jgi:serine/threonine-protein kinase
MIAAGTKLDRYEIRSKIGEGGMGEVYLAQDTRLHRNVAPKILPADLSSNKDRMRRFEQEATSGERLVHFPIEGRSFYGSTARRSAI